jgi:hypothetical protein
MTKDEAWLIVRMADAIGEEGIWHHVSGTLEVDDVEDVDPVDARVLAEAVRLAWDLMPRSMQENLGPCPDRD